MNNAESSLGPRGTTTSAERGTEAETLETLETWRWRSYTAHLADLGYDLDGGGPPDDLVDRAIAGSRRRGVTG